MNKSYNTEQLRCWWCLDNKCASILSLITDNLSGAAASTQRAQYETKQIVTTGPVACVSFTAILLSTSFLMHDYCTIPPKNPQMRLKTAPVNI